MAAGCEAASEWRAAEYEDGGKHGHQWYTDRTGRKISRRIRKSIIILNLSLRKQTREIYEVERSSVLLGVWNVFSVPGFSAS